MRIDFAVGLALVCAAPLAAQKDAEKADLTRPADTVRLRFGWPVGLNARVSAQKFKARARGQGKVDTTNVRLAYQLTVEPHTSGRLVRFHHFEVPGVPRVEDVEERASALMPSVIVDSGGAFITMVDVESMQRELDVLLGPSTRNPLIERFRSAEVLNALAANEWNALVGAWTDSDLGIGLTYSAEFELPFPLLPGAMLPMVQEFTAIARVPCTANESEQRCVELESAVYPDEEAFRALLERIMSQALQSDTVRLPVIEDYDVETTIRLIAEPSTLIPHFLEVGKRITMRAKSPGGVAEEVDQEEIKTTRYEYSGRRP